MGLDSFGEKAAKSYNEFQEMINMTKPAVLKPLSTNTAVLKPNPYKQKPYYIDNRHSFVLERDVRDGYHDFIPPPYEYHVINRKQPVDLHVPKDPVFGHLGGAEIDFGGNQNKEDKNNKTSQTNDKKKEVRQLAVFSRLKFSFSRLLHFYM